MSKCSRYGWGIHTSAHIYEEVGYSLLLVIENTINITIMKDITSWPLSYSDCSWNFFLVHAPYFIFLKIFFIWTICKVFIESVIILFMVYVLGFFGPEACGIYAPQPGTKPVLPALEGEVWDTGSPVKSLVHALWKAIY